LLLLLLWLSGVPTKRRDSIPRVLAVVKQEMAMVVTVVLFLGLAIAAMADQQNKGGSGSGNSCVNGKCTAGNVLLQQSQPLTNVLLATESEYARQTVIVGAMECIARTWAPIMTTAGHEDAEVQLKNTMAEAMAEMIESPASNGQIPTLAEASNELWKSYGQWYCAVSKKSDCTIMGHSFNSVLSRVRTESGSDEQANLIDEHTVQLKGSSGAGADSSADPRHQQTQAKTIKDVERSHGFQPGALVPLASGLQVLSRRGISKPDTLRLLAEQAVEEAAVLLGALDGQSKLRKLKPLVAAMVQILKSHDSLLRALGEPADLAQGESLHASAEVLLGQGGCKDITAETAPNMGLTTAVTMLIKPYMQLHCGANKDCHATYATVVGGSADYGNSLLQKTAGAVKEASLLMLKGAAAATMHFIGVQRFDTADFVARSSAPSAFETSAAASSDLATVRVVVKGLLRHEQVNVRQLIQVVADLIRCSSDVGAEV